MKKVFALMLCTAMGLSLFSACGGGEVSSATSETSTDVPSSVSISETSQASVSDTVSSSEVSQSQAPEIIQLENPNFRNTVWGMSMEEVEASENALFEEVEEGKALGFRDELLGHPVMVGYLFLDDSLAMARYVFDYEHTNDAMYYNDFLDLQEAYTEEYGEPVSVVENFGGFGSDMLYATLPQGYAGFETRWQTESTDIIARLTGGNFEVNMNVNYVPTGSDPQEIIAQVLNTTDGI